MIELISLNKRINSILYKHIAINLKQSIHHTCLSIVLQATVTIMSRMNDKGHPFCCGLAHEMSPFTITDSAWNPMRPSSTSLLDRRLDHKRRMAGFIQRMKRPSGARACSYRQFASKKRPAGAHRLLKRHSFNKVRIAV